jgi:hypothetical protein
MLEKNGKQTLPSSLAPLLDTLGNYNVIKVGQNDEVNKLDIELALHFKGQSTYK